MVSMPVRDEKARDTAGVDLCNSKLPLDAFSAVHEDVFRAVAKKNAGMIPALRRDCLSCAKKGDVGVLAVFSILRYLNMKLFFSRTFEDIF